MLTLDDRGVLEKLMADYAQAEISHRRAVEVRHAALHAVTEFVNNHEAAAIRGSLEQPGTRPVAWLRKSSLTGGLDMSAGYIQPVPGDGWFPVYAGKAPEVPLNLIVTRGGVPVADQAQGIRDFKAACGNTHREHEGDVRVMNTDPLPGGPLEPDDSPIEFPLPGVNAPGAQPAPLQGHYRAYVYIGGGERVFATADSIKHLIEALQECDESSIVRLGKVRK